MNLFRPFCAITGTVLLLGSFITRTACEPKPIDPSVVVPEPGSGIGTAGKAGYLVGKVTDPKGNPLPRAIIFTDNTVVKGQGAEVTTTTDGTYSLQLVKDLGQWIVKGYILKQYNDRVYKIYLDPENADSFTDTEKPVRNFQWKLTGPIPDLSLYLYYGGTMELFHDLNANELRDNENIEFTLTPVGPLIDGSTGKKLTLRAKKRYETYLKDIPIGRYKVTAVYTPTGEMLRVRDSYKGDSDYTYRSSVTVDFTGRESATRANMLGIGYTNH